MNVSAIESTLRIGSAQFENCDCIKITIHLKNGSYIGHNGGQEPVVNNYHLKLISHCHRSFTFASDKGAFTHCFKESGDYFIKVVVNNNRSQLEVRPSNNSCEIYYLNPIPDFSKRY